MAWPSASSSATLLAVQIGAVASILLGMAFAPPARGAMLLVPLWPGAEQGMAARAVRNGARLLGPGPLPHSLVVLAERGRMGAGLAHGVLPLAAPELLCGGTGRTERAG